MSGEVTTRKKKKKTTERKVDELDDAMSVGQRRDEEVVTPSGGLRYKLLLLALFVGK
jgi:hypothetical protein